MIAIYIQTNANDKHSQKIRVDHAINSEFYAALALLELTKKELMEKVIPVNDGRREITE